MGTGNILGTAFATGGFEFDPSLSPNNQSFGMAVLAVVRRAGITGGGGGGTIFGTVGGNGSAAGSFAGFPLTTGTFTLNLTQFAGTAPGVVPVSPGGTLSFLRSDGAWTGALPNGGCIITVFNNLATATQTWTKNPATTAIEVLAIGGGGCGGGGAKEPSATVAGGGGGGAGGGLSYMWFNGADIPSTVVITFSGTRGTGGLGGTNSAQAGAQGTPGASSNFGNFLFANGGPPGNGGATSGGGGGSGAAGLWQSGSNGATGGGAAAGSNGSDLATTADTDKTYAPTGGGGGGGVSTTPTPRDGGRGGQGATFVITTGGTAGANGGTTNGVNGGNGGNSGFIGIGGGGGGGGGTGTPAGSGGNGGNGGNYGGGGGGGAGALNGPNPAGNGGLGGLAGVIVIEWGSNLTGIAPANPTSQVSTTGTNGTALTYMRSDAAPAIDQTMSPTWSGTHTFTTIFGTLTFTGGPTTSIINGVTVMKVNGTGSPTMQGYAPTAAGLQDMTPDSVTGIATLTGAGIPTLATGTFTAVRNGRVTTLWVPAMTAAGTTSNNAVQINCPGLPASFQARTNDARHIVPVTAAGTVAPGLIIIAAASTVFTLQPAITGGTFTGTLTRGLSQNQYLTFLNQS